MYSSFLMYCMGFYIFMNIELSISYFRKKYQEWSLYHSTPAEWCLQGPQWWVTDEMMINNIIHLHSLYRWTWAVKSWVSFNLRREYEQSACSKWFTFERKLMRLNNTRLCQSSSFLLQYVTVNYVCFGLLFMINYLLK